MRYPHISISNDLDLDIKKYSESRNIKYSAAVSELTKYGFKYLHEEKNIDQNNMLLDRIYNKEIYIKKLLEQLYSDLEIDNHTNPNNNKSLNQFKNKQYKDSYID